MALDRIHLHKLLKFMMLPERRRLSEIRKEIRQDMRRERYVESSGGGDFYVAFWADARAHVFGTSDLTDSVRNRIALSAQRRNLYPRLRDGFLQWWNERRRWTNEPFQPGHRLQGRMELADLGATVKVDAVLSVRDAQGVEHFVYPYFYPEPIVDEETARIGLWVLRRVLTAAPAEEIRILDIIRGQTFSIDRYPLQGNEEALFLSRYAALLVDRDIIQSEIDNE
ncbi:MAG: hypothetical protein EON58_01695 [Alphaproteobacteria bacterium]|nr:MAG: hypothetical protein EON58_01695 [Alphaproteobacteria bacterium]